MKLSEYVVSFIEQNVADSFFLLSGGGIMHLVDSVGRAKKLKSYCCHHEQAAAIAAEGYARVKNDIGVVLVTTGPGGTNAITGVAGAWLDSIPMLVISGQVKTDNITPRKNGAPTVRAIGFQELNVIDMVKPITKYAVTVEEPHEIKYHLEKAIHLAKSGRPGPVWIEIPLDIQAADIDPKTLPSFTPRPEDMFTQPKIPMELIIKKLREAKRPLLLAGNGIRLGGGAEILQKVLKKLSINTATVIFTADDLVTYEYPYYLGRQGMWGNQPANYAIDNCDVLLVIGDRLQLTQTSYDYQNFATQAFKIMVDIDEAELTKKTLAIDLPVHADAKVFLEELYKQELKLNRWDIAVPQINPDEYKGKAKYLNVYDFHKALSNYSKKGLHVATADGQASVSPHQALKIVQGQRFITNAGLGHMGSGLPLAIGACIANNEQPVLCMD
ncbi:MAG TPA: thiamine pyrophosphate-binding protein, partial [Patescibacteria group bacterium]|nr:thiamine pyrophosphate-binding protein [Patescibacteria group bacterium]